MWNYELEVCNLLSTNLEMSSSLTIVKRLFKQTNIENCACAVSFFADPHKVIFFFFVQLVLRCFVELVLLRFRASAPLKTTWGGWCRCSCPYHSFVNLLPNSFAPPPCPFCHTRNAPNTCNAPQLQCPVKNDIVPNIDWVFTFSYQIIALAKKLFFWVPQC